MPPAAGPKFADYFWSADYAAGLGVLFGKLQQGVIENRQVLAIIRLRTEAEEVYGQRLADITPTVDKIQGGFSRDDGATIRKAYESVRTEMEEGGKNHKKVAQNIRDLVVNPFSRWCDAHEQRVQDSQDWLQACIKAHDKQAESVKKLRSNYFNKCRLVEDLEEENKLAFQDLENSPKGNLPEIKVNREEENLEEDMMYEVGDETYTAEYMKNILRQMLENIRMGETKVPILGTYINTSTGSDIVEYLQKYMNATSVSYSERIGQDLVTNKFLRLVGAVGNTFANSSKMFYQWTSPAFKLAGVPERKSTITRTLSMQTTGSEGSESPVVGTVTEYLEKWNIVNNAAHPNETPPERLRREAREADEKYKSAVLKLDQQRCDLEDEIVKHLTFMQICEGHRLQAIKKVVADLSVQISNVIPILQSAIDNISLYHGVIQEDSDMRYMVENYRTGSFIPKVVTYENYYNRVDDQTFGVDLEARARADKKLVPMIVTTILTLLDHHYPDLEGDKARRGVWLTDVPLAETHQLRRKVIESGPTPEVLLSFGIPTVASLLKLYLLELPDSLISSHVYEIIRTIYQTSGPDGAEGARIPVLQQTLSQLRLSNIATLDACMNHFTRLIELTSADEAYVEALATSLSTSILRPRIQTSLSIEEKHASRLIRDLFAHKNEIFGELKRMSTLNHSKSVGSGGGTATAVAAERRGRAISTDESNRRALMEERNRLLVEKVAAGTGGSRSRATSPAPGPRDRARSPAPGPRGHRRDKSSGGPETRFPISTGLPMSPTAVTPQRHSVSLGLGVKRSSLEVPGHEMQFGGPLTLASAQEEHHQQYQHSMAENNGAASAANGSVGGDSPKIGDTTVSKRNSLGRSGARFVGGKRVTPMAPVTGPDGGHAQHGVTLVDRPMED